MRLVKKLSIYLSGILAYLLVPLKAYADTKVDPCTGAPDGIAKILCGMSNDVAGTIQRVVVFLVIIAIVVALMYLLYGGIKWIMSKGEKTEVEAARNHITAAITGLIVVFLAIFILSLVLAAFGIKWEQLVIPKIAP
jgi:hypothetical protein